jgi:hypothetical protein
MSAQPGPSRVVHDDEQVQRVERRDLHRIYRSLLPAAF